jgi:hypothetical protein
MLLPALIEQALKAEADSNTIVEWVANSNAVYKSVVIVGGYQLTLTERRWPRSGSRERNEFYQTTRVYGAFDALIPNWMLVNADNGIGRNKAISATKKALVEVLKDLCTFEGVTVPESAVTDIRFSKHAGCTMCPCSPGMVLGGVVRSERDGRPVDIWIEKIA